MRRCWCGVGWAV